MLVNAPPSEGYAKAKDVDCTESVGAPVTDTIVTALFASLAIVLLVPGSDDGEGSGGRGIGGPGGPGLIGPEAVGAILVVPTIIYGVSAADGYEETSACRAEVKRLGGRAPKKETRRRTSGRFGLDNR